MRKIPNILLTLFIAVGLAAVPVMSSAATDVPVVASSRAKSPSGATAYTVIADAKASDPGFKKRRALMASSDAFVLVLQQTTTDYKVNLDFFAAISTDQQAADLVVNTAGKHYVVSGTQENPDVQLVAGEASDAADLGVNAKSAMPRCAKAWAAFSAWLVGTTLLCAPFSGPAAWACALTMGLLGLMPDFNKACK